MANALICTVGITIDRQNDLTDVLAQEIRAIGPARVVFLASAESCQNARRVAEISRLAADTFDLVELSSPHNLNEIFEKSNEVIRRLQALGFTKNDIMVNYTGGTKVMGSGVVLSAVFHQCQELRYVFEGNGSGQKVISTTPKAVFAFRDLHISSRLIQEMRYQSALDLMAGMDASLLSEYDVRSLNALRQVAQAYSNWDSFHHAEFVRLIREVPGDLDMVTEFLVDDTQLSLLGRIAEDVETNRYSEPMFADMVNNAVRRSLEGRYDDAVARVYRALEMLAQWVLKRFEIDTDDLETRKVPPRHRVSFEALRSFEDGCVRIGMRKAYELLALLDVPLGKHFESNEELAHFLGRRGQSILAHGTHPISKEECSRLIASAVELLKMESKDFGQMCAALQFPWLRHTCS